MNVEVVRQKLVDGDADAVLKELVDLYRRAEILHTPQLGRILEALFPVWKGLLHTKLPPQLRATTPNRCRKVLLQIMNRLPSNEALRPYVPQLLQLLMEVLQKDNEDNALIALKTLFDLHRNYRPGLRNEVQPFLELVQLMYKNLPVTMKKQFSGAPETHKASTTTAPTAAKSTTSAAPGDDSNVPTNADTAASSTTGESAAAATPQPAQTTSAESETTTRDSGSGADAITDEPISSNLESFKTISELPLIIMLLFQCYPSYIESYIPVLVPLMMSALALRAPETAPTTHPMRYLDFLDCQVKTLSFVTYLLRGCANMMRPFQDAICENTVKLLIACPKDAFVLRKDIFVAARHIISTDFRRGFYPQLELLMDDDVLVGKGRCSFYQIRPLAYSTLADMIHHVRDMLSLTQVSTIVDFYGKRIHDPTLPISIQTTSIRLLLNLVDISAKNEDADAWKGRNILSRILLIISGKFGTTLDNLPMALATTLRNKSSSDRSDLLEGGAMDKIKQSSLLPKEVVPKTLDEKKLEALLLPHLRVQRPGDSVSEEEPSIRDIKSLLRTMILGIRAVIWCTANYRNPHAKDLSTVDANTMDGSGIVAVSAPSSIDTVGSSTSRLSSSNLNDGNGAEHAYPLTDDERLLIAKVLRNGLRCFILYTLSENTVSEEKQMLDHFAGAFTVLEAADFRDLFISNIQLLYECILQDHAILTIPQHFLANSNVSCWFAEILLKFLITQMKDLSVEAEGDLPDTKRVDKVMTIESLEFENMRSVPQVHRASIVLRLFKIVFGSVTLFKSNESALFPHLRTIIESCLKQATFTKHPDNYLLLLRALFRSISGGKYENFYKEVFPLLPGVLSALMRLQKHIGKPAMREVLLELCLTIPARLSSLLQYLPSLMKSVVRAILSRGELAYLGLRTLEFWVDNLNPDFLYPIMTSQDRLLTEIIEALNTHLIPPPYPYGELAMRVLGKIGGRNRQYLMDPLNLDNHDHSFTGLTFTFEWDGENGGIDFDMKGDSTDSGTFPMKMDALVSQATKVLRTYLRRTPVERGHVSKVDSRLVDVDEFEEGENLPGPSFLLEKDDKTLQLETETMAKIRGSILHHKRCAFTFVSRAAVLSFNTDDYADTNQEGCGKDQNVSELDAEHLKPMRKVISQEALRSSRKQLLEVLFETMVDVDDTEVFQMFVVEFLSPKAPSRQYAKQCISTIASLQETTASALLYPYNQLISKQITGCNLRMLPGNTRAGYVDAMAYALSLEPPIFTLTKEIMVFLQEREHLVEIKYSSLFQQLIKIPEAAPLRAVIIDEGDSKGGADVSNDSKMQAQIQLNAQKAAAQAVASAQAQGMTASVAEARGVQARAAYVVKAQAQVNAQQALKVQSQVQIQANAQKLHAQTLAAAQAQGLSLVQAQAKAQFASKDYIAKAQSHISSSGLQDPNVNNIDVMDLDTVMWMLREILASKDYPPESMQTLRIELLKLGTLLIQHMSKYVTDQLYDTPPKIVLQVYVALLRTHEMDARFLVRKAFDILLPALPSRLPSNEFIKAIKWTKKIAYEEGHVLGQLVHIWFLIVRHPALFYPFRGQFVPLMVNSLNRLAIPPSSTPDNRRLAVNIVDLVISWEQTRQDRLTIRGSSSSSVSKASSPNGELKRSLSVMNATTADEISDDHAEKRRKVSDTEKSTMSAGKTVQVQLSTEPRTTESTPLPGQTESSVSGLVLQGQQSTSPPVEINRSSNAEDEFELSSAMVDLVINFAFRFALASADKQETSRLAKTCGDLFDKALRLWPSASIRFSYFDKLIAVTAETVIRQQQQLQASMNAAAAAGNTGQQVSAPAPPPPTVMPPFFVVPKGAPLSSLAILDAVLGILNSLITPEVVSKSKRPMPYVIQYAPRIMKLLEPCFDRQNHEIQSSLTMFLRRMTELYPPSRAPQPLVVCKFYPWLREIINERLVNATMYQQDLATMSGIGIAGGSAALASKAKGKTTSQSVAGSKTEKHGVATSSNNVGVGSSHSLGSGKHQKDPSGINPLINHEAARMRLLFSQHPRVVVSPTSYPGEFTLKLLNGLAEIAPEFVDHFAPALLKLAQRFTREHLIQSAAAGGSGSGSGGKHGGSSNGAAIGVESGKAVVDSFGRNRVMATPSLAIVNEWNQMQAGRSNLAVNNIVRHVISKRDASTEKTASKKKGSGSDQPVASEAAGSANVKTNSAMKKKLGTGANNVASRATLVGASSKRPIELLVLCYGLLAKCSFTTGEHKRLYTNLLVHCLEGSYNIPLLLQITQIVAKMIASTDVRHQVLTTKDKMTLLSKMSTFDRLNEISALPLNEEYYQLVLKLCNPPPGDAKHHAPYLHISPTPQSHSLTTHFMAGLLAPDAATREKFLQIFFAAADSGPVARLQLVLRQDWQACGTRYWPVIAIETLMAAISPNSSPTVAEVSSNVALSSSKPEKTTAHAEFLSTVKSSELTMALRDLAHIDMELAKELWVNLFSAAWRLLQESEQTQVTGQLLKILASKYNKRDLNVPLGASTPRRTNVVQTLMKGIVNTSPSAPVMTPELVLHVASAYDVWSCAMRLCEFQVEQSDLSVESRLRWIESLSAIYKQLSEDDLRIGLSLENIAQPETRTALTLEALGCVHEAQEEYFRALSKAQSGRVSVEDVNLFELRLWEERWVGCAKQLCQWQLMNDFAKSTQNQELLLDCAWKRGDWASAKQLLLSPSMQSSAELGCPQTRLQRLYISILDADKRTAIDALAAQTAELALHQWQGLPRILSRAHLPLMHLFHKFVEVKESIQMMEDIKLASAQHAALPNLKPSINTWRERLPNKWEPILLWDDILTWRSHMFQVVKTTFAWSDAQMLACMHDSPWSVIKLAHTARKQRLPDVCLGALAKLYSVPAMDVQDAFSKLREQVSICYESATEYSGGLSILNTTNLDYFSLRQKAEMFRLKALFLEAQGALPEANQTFSHCLQICDSYGKGWLSWGHYCYRLFLVRKELALASQTIACYLQAIHHRCNSARLMIARVLWLLNMDDRRGVLIQAFESHGKQLPIWIWIIWIPQLLMALGRPEAPQIRGLLRGLSAKFPQALYYTMRAFFLENRDNAMALANHQQQLAPTSSTVSPSSGATSQGETHIYYRTKSGHVVGVPSTMSVSQVQGVPGLVGPPRPTPAAFNVAPGVVLTLDAWNEKVRSNGGDAHVSKAEVGPVLYTEDLLNFLRRSHDSLTFEMECMLEEMITRFRPEPEEELLTAVHALLLKCYQLPRLTKTEPVPKMLRAALTRVCRKLFVLLPHQKNDKHEAFVAEFKDAFERDFTPLGNDLPQQGGPVITLYKIMNRLKRWKSLLQLRVKKVGKRNAGKLYLEQCSRHLMELSSSNMEVPGQYVSDSEPIKDLHARILHFESTVDVLLRNGFTQRRVAMGGSDGRAYYFLVQYAMTHITRTDERMMQMYLLLNRLLLRHKETKKRNTVFHVPKVIPLTPRVRLLEDNRDFVTLGEIYELDCQIENTDPDLPVELYRERVSEAYAAAGAVKDSSQQEDERVAQAKARAFHEICNEHVPETLLAKYVHGISVHSDAYFQFRSEFTKHLALSSFLSYALFVGDRAPHRVLFSRRTGRVVSTELRPGYASSGILEAATAMPFRLTRNLHSFMTRPGVQGPFSVGMTAAAEALMGEEDILSNQLCLFFRDDLLSWHASKTRLVALDPQAQTAGRVSSPAAASGATSPSLSQQRVESQVQQRVEANVSLVLERIRGVSLKKESGESARGKSVRELLEIATSPERQRDMYPTWYPWL
ncbi:hypothetical protein PHYBOEH_000823 [Phytophthora boehmeriae]|uniref:Non-specific serine/threonine protein kinase n=1 Tax=Phytophthora boehmeriae TaxID=109152 RepID=A0A8T1WU72_9STRA|nr:hypothetical protein PHYBOEH_000823 [Phytophthora boehmeriae]